MRFTRLPRARLDPQAESIDIVQRAPRAVPNPKPSQPDSSRPLHLVIWWVVKPAASARTPRLLILVQPCVGYTATACFVQEGGRIFYVSVAASRMGGRQLAG
jgi:hypothetical protein